MTTTNPVSTPTATSTSTSTSPTKTLASNFDTFLKLLTTQLQNQDPTSPMDSTQFTQQLVMYSQVEQQINTNDNLTKLISLTQGQANNLAMSYIGKNIVLSDGSGQLQNSAASWTYGLDNNASATSLTIKNSNGQVVYSAQGATTAGSHSFAWDGKNLNGDIQPDGLYTMTVSSTAKDGTSVATSVASKAQVSGVDLSGTSPQLVIGSSEVPLTSATLITN